MNAGPGSQIGLFPVQHGARGSNLGWCDHDHSIKHLLACLHYAEVLTAHTLIGNIHLTARCECMTYEDYIASAGWKRLRLDAIARDGGRCRTCNTDQDLEVHHRRYPREWQDDSLDNLTTLCRDCHETITSLLRAKRYRNEYPVVVDSVRLTPVRVEVMTNAVSEIQLQNTRNRPAANAQSALIRSLGPDIQTDQKDFWKEGKDGSRPRGNGETGMVRRSLSERQEPRDSWRDDRSNTCCRREEIQAWRSCKGGHNL